MALGIAKVTSQGQISVPAGVRKKLSIVPGSLLEFEERGDEVVVRRKGIYTFDDLHKRLFPKGPTKTAPTTQEMKQEFSDYTSSKEFYLQKQRLVRINSRIL